MFHTDGGYICDQEGGTGVPPTTVAEFTVRLYLIPFLNIFSNNASAAQWWHVSCMFQWFRSVELSVVHICQQ